MGKRHEWIKLLKRELRYFGELALLYNEMDLLYSVHWSTVY